MTTTVCTGRALDAGAQPVGEPHGKIGHGDLAELRAAGWRIGPPGADGARPAMCPACARPDPYLVRLCASLARHETSSPDLDASLMDTLPGM